MKVMLSLALAGSLVALASAQVRAPNPQGSNTLAESIEQSADRSTLLRGNVRMQITGTVDLRADEIDVSADGRTMLLRGNVVVMVPATPGPVK